MVCEAIRSRTLYVRIPAINKGRVLHQRVLNLVCHHHMKSLWGIHTQKAVSEVLASSEATTAEDGFVEMKCVVGYLVLGLASGLEAFSREPPCDSIGALAVRQTPETSGMAREFLSYCPLLPSRYLRDPFTISKLFFREFVDWKFSLNSCWNRTMLPSTHRRRRPKNGPQFALREYLSQFPAK